MNNNLNNRPKVLVKSKINTKTLSGYSKAKSPEYHAYQRYKRALVKPKINTETLSGYAKAKSPEYHAYQQYKRAYEKTKFKPGKFYKRIIEKY